MAEVKVVLSMTAEEALKIRELLANTPTNSLAQPTYLTALLRQWDEEEYALIEKVFNALRDLVP